MIGMDDVGIVGNAPPVAGCTEADGVELLLLPEALALVLLEGA